MISRMLDKVLGFMNSSRYMHPSEFTQPNTHAFEHLSCVYLFNQRSTLYYVPAADWNEHNKLLG